MGKSDGITAPRPVISGAETGRTMKYLTSVADIHYLRHTRENRSSDRSIVFE